MSERDGSSTTDPEQKELPPIPDGGLGKGLPSWLAEPPSRPVKPTGEPTPIDLGALGADAQLPTWLQDLSARVAQDRAPEADGGADAESANDVVEIVAQAAQVPEMPTTVAPAVETTPAETGQPVVATQELRPVGVYLLLAAAAIVLAVVAVWLIWF